MTFDVQKFLEDPNSTYVALIKCTEVSHLLATNKEFQAKFLSTQFLYSIFQILVKTNDHCVHKHFVSLTQTLNPILSPRFADNLLLTEAAFAIIDSQHDNASYAFGTISRFLFYAVHNYPAELQEIFDISTKIYPIIIRNIHKLSLLVFVNDIFSERTLKMDYFVWLCFKALVGEEESNKFTPVPLCQYLRTPVDCSSITLNEIQSENIIKLFILYFQNNESNESTFSAHVIKYISAQKEISPLLFDLAFNIPLPMNEIAMKAFKTTTSFRNADRAANYLLKCSKILPKDMLEYIIYILLTDSRSTNQMLNMLPKFVECVVEELKNLKEITNILMYSWNIISNSDELFMKRPFIIKIISKIIELPQEENLIFPQNYISSVVEPWNNDGDVDFDFRFDKSEIDSDFIEFLKHLFENDK